MTEKIVVTVDESPQSANALRWACRNLTRPDVELHLVTVLPPIVHTVYPVAPFATAAAVSAVTQHWDAQKSHDEVVAKDILQNALNIATSEGKLERQSIVTVALPAAGGASGVGDSIVEYAMNKDVDLVIVGSRGLGAVKRSLMSMIGLGSVSDYCVHNMHCPVIVTRYDGKPQPSKENEDPQQPRRICVACDDSAHAELALTWAVKHMQPVDQLHLLTVALPVPYPVLDEPSMAATIVWEQQDYARRSAQAAQDAQLLCRRVVAAAQLAGMDKIVDDAYIAASGIWQGQQWEAQQQEVANRAKVTANNAVAAAAAAGVDKAGALIMQGRDLQSGAVALATAINEKSTAERNALIAERAWGTVRRAVLEAGHIGIAKERIVYKVLGPEGGASDVGASICHYAEHNQIDLVVLGSRGLGSFQRSVMSIIGLGSVSDYCVHNLKAPVVVVKSTEAAAAAVAGAAAAATKIGNWQAPVPAEPMAQSSADKME